jgi:hypothetical protein
MTKKKPGVTKAMPILPSKKGTKPLGRTAYLPTWMWGRLEEIAEESKADDPKEGYSRNEVIVRFLEKGIADYEAERRLEAEKKSKR